MIDAYGGLFVGKLTFFWFQLYNEFVSGEVQYSAINALSLRWSRDWEAFIKNKSSSKSVITMDVIFFVCQGCNDWPMCVAMR